MWLGSCLIPVFFAKGLPCRGHVAPARVPVQGARFFGAGVLSYFWGCWALGVMPSGFIGLVAW